MGKLQLVDRPTQLVAQRPPPGTEVNVAADVASTKWVYGVRWGGEERYRFSTPAGLEHLRALVERFEVVRYALRTKLADSATNPRGICRSAEYR